MRTEVETFGPEAPPAAADAAPETAGTRPPLGDLVVFLLALAVAIAAALGVAAALLTVTDASPGTVLSAMVRGSVGSTPALVTTLNHAGLILIVAVGACVAFRAGLVNIGQEGQISVGALLGAAVGLALPFSGGAAIVLVLLASAAGGALWTLLPAYLRYGRGASEVVTTLLMNFLAFQLVSYAVNSTYLLQEDPPPGSVLPPSPQSNRLPEDDRLPALVSGIGYRLHIGVVIAVALAAVVAFVIARTRWGFRLRVFGHNTDTARRAGVRPARMGGTALLVSGAFAGLAGGVLLTGVVLRIQGGFASGIHGSFSNNFGWEGLLVALVAGFRVLHAIPIAFLFGALRAGAGVLASTGVSPTIAGVVQALVVLAVTLPSFFLLVRQRRRQAALLRLERA